MSNGIVAILSKHSVEETIDRLQRLLRDKGVKLFALVDHSGDAEQSGMKMQNISVVETLAAKAGE